MKKKHLWLILAFFILIAVVSSVCVLATGQQKISADKVYLSDMKYESYKMEGSYKPWLDDDTSGNGKINLSNVMSFDKGIRMHPDASYAAEIVYDISGMDAYKFASYIGPDMDGTVGKIQFLVYVDGVLKYTSPLMQYGDYQYIEIDVMGAKTLRLVENDGGDGYFNDGGCWADAALYCAHSEGVLEFLTPESDKIMSDSVTFTGAAKAEQVSLYVGDTKLGTAKVDGIAWSLKAQFPAGIADGTELTVRVDAENGGKVLNSAERTMIYHPNAIALSELSVTATGKTALLINGSKGDSLTIGTTDISRGLETQAFTKESDGGLNVTVAAGGYTYYEGMASLNYYQASPDASVVFRILADGTEIWRSEKIARGGVAYITAQLPAGTQQLTFLAEASGETQAVNWSNGIFYRSADAKTAFIKPIYSGNVTESGILDQYRQQLKTDAAIEGLILHTEGAITGSFRLDVYKYQRSCQRSVQEAAVSTSSLCLRTEENTYYVPFAEELEAGEYLLVFHTADKVTIKLHKGSGMAAYSLTSAIEGAIKADVVLSAESGKVMPVKCGVMEATVGNTATEAEKLKAKIAYEGYLKNLETFPCSMKIGEISYHGFGSDFVMVSQTKETDKDNKEIEHAVTVLRHTSGLEFTIYSEYYANYAAYEWVIYFTNASNTASPVVTDLKAIDLTLTGADPFINTSYGDSRQFLPNNQALNGAVTFAPEGGKSTLGAFPYYNFEYGDEGAILSLGWSGQWSCTFDNTAKADETHITAGQETFNAYLKPGETVRTPLVALIFYKGNDLDRATNLWRHWFIDCSMHRVADTETGELTLFAPGVSGGTSVQYSEMTEATDANQTEAIRQYIEHGININYWWMDAGWYYDTNGNSLAKGDWTPTGSWQVDTSRFPSQMKDISDYGASVGVKTLLWFEPERVGGDLKVDGTTVNPAWILNGQIVNEGNVNARDWLLNRILNIMGNGNISLYREDFNIQPLSSWEVGDQQKGENRNGITENLYVQGHLYIWDNILQKYPSVMIDACASGGHRNDLEAARRSVQLHKTDYAYGDSNAQQCYALEMYAWLPYFGTKADTTGATDYADRYYLRTALVAWTVLGYDSDKPIDWDIVRDVVEEHETLEKYTYSDYYKLTPYSRDDDAPMAWEFFDPADQSGYALIYRRSQMDAVTHLTLKGLNPETSYHIWFEDRGAHQVLTGVALMTDGVDVTIPTGRSSDIMYISTEYTPRDLEASITQVNRDGQYAGAICLSDGQYEVDIRLNMALRDTVLTASETEEQNVIGDYLDVIMIGGKTLRELNAQNAGAVTANYDVLNNILRLYIEKDNSFGFGTNADQTIVLSGNFANYEGAKLAKEITYQYDASEKTWYKLGVDVTDIRIVTPRSFVRLGSTMLLTAYVTPYDATYGKAAFSVSDPSVASIDENGYLTALKTGTVTVTASAKDASGKSVSVTIEVVSADYVEPVETQPVPEESTTDTTPAAESKTRLSTLAILYIAVIVVILAAAAIAVVIILKKRRDRAAILISMTVLIAVALTALFIFLITQTPKTPVSGMSETTISASGDSARPSEDSAAEVVTRVPSDKKGLINLTDMEYLEALCNGGDYPFYHKIPSTGDAFTVAGKTYENGIFINAYSSDIGGYVIYDISGYDYDRFTCKFGKLDLNHGSGAATYLNVYIDGELLFTSPKMKQGNDAALIDLEIPVGAKQLKLECCTTGDYVSCSSVIGDGRLYYSGTDIVWP